MSSKKDRVPQSYLEISMWDDGAHIKASGLDESAVTVQRIVAALLSASGENSALMAAIAITGQTLIRADPALKVLTDSVVDASKDSTNEVIRSVVH